jgi:hypothetical protein
MRVGGLDYLTSNKLIVGVGCCEHGNELQDSIKCLLYAEMLAFVEEPRCMTLVILLSTYLVRFIKTGIVFT